MLAKDLKIIILTDSKNIPGETEIITKCFENGLDLLHIRKPSFSKQQMENYLSEIPRKYWDQIILHTHFQLAIKYNLRGIHVGKRSRKNKLLTKLRIWYMRFKKPEMIICTSFHHLASLFEETTHYDYVILSPIFDSISKSGFQSGFSHHNLDITIKRSPYKVVALGGVEESRVEQVLKMKFEGMMLSGIIWQSQNKFEEFLKVRNKLTLIQKSDLAAAIAAGGQ